jgi:RNA polymerase sigma-70 factor (ECF subfamily)
MHNETHADALLVARFKQGDDKAFTELAVKYHSRLVRLAFRIIPDKFYAEEVVQETLINAYRALGNYRGEAAFYTWIYRICLNEAFNVLSSLKRHRRAAGPNDGEGFNESVSWQHDRPDLDTPEALLSTKQVLSALADALAGLPDELRVAVELRELQALSYGDISAAMECPIGTVRSRLSRARDAMATSLDAKIDGSLRARWS